jgi:hypothetical protein
MANMDFEFLADTVIEKFYVSMLYIPCGMLMCRGAQVP